MSNSFTAIEDAAKAMDVVARSIAAEVGQPAYNVAIAYSPEDAPSTPEDPAHVWTITITYKRARSRGYVGHATGHGPTVAAARDDAIDTYRFHEADGAVKRTTR